MAVPVRRFSESVRMASSLFNRVRSHRYFPVTVIALLVLMVACLHIWQRVVVMQLAREVSTLRADHDRLLDESRKVESDIAALSMSARIETYARDSLGLKPVAADRLFTIVKQRPQKKSPDELATIVSSIRRVAAYIPTVAPAEAAANELDEHKADTPREENR